MSHRISASKMYEDIHFAAHSLRGSEDTMAIRAAICTAVGNMCATLSMEIRAGATTADIETAMVDLHGRCQRYVDSCHPKKLGHDN